MPADSTAQIGEHELAGMGSDVPVSVSAGEYQLPPEQVHAIGVQTLDQMKNATHAPVAPIGFKPELFFANGGVVDDPRKPSLFSRIGNKLQSMDSSLTRMPVGYGLPDLGDAKNLRGMAADTGEEISYLAGQGQYARAAGAGLRGALGMIPAAAADVTAESRKKLQPVVDFGNALFGVDPTPAVATPGQKPTASDRKVPSVSAAAPVNSDSAAPVPGISDAFTVADTASPSAAPALDNDVRRIGNAFSGSNIRAGYTVNGSPPELHSVEQSPQNQVAIDALLARTPAFAEGGLGVSQPAGFQPGGPAVTILNDAANDRARQQLLNAATTPYRGAQNGQLTANQLNALRGVVESDDRNAATRYSNDTANSTALQQAQMREQGANLRAALEQQGANTRAAAVNGVEQEKLSDQRVAQGFQTRAAQRLEKLYQRYENAAPEERSAIAQQIRDLNGKETPSRFTVVPGGQEIDPITQQVITRPASVINNQSGQFVTQQRQLPPIEQNPAVQAIVNNTKLSREERARQIRALGYE